MLKRLDVLVLDEATAILDGPSPSAVMRSLIVESRECVLIWLVQRASLGQEFHQAIVLERGKFLKQGHPTGSRSARQSAVFSTPEQSKLELQQVGGA
jgi:ABC-type bacteriocin/lantibiotic exporter with double-glycine peptidase domain